MGEPGRNLVEVDERGDASVSNALRGTDDGQKTMASRLQKHLRRDVDPDQSSIPLVAYCFMTGFMYVQDLFFVKY